MTLAETVRCGSSTAEITGARLTCGRIARGRDSTREIRVYSSANQEPVTFYPGTWRSHLPSDPEGQAAFVRVLSTFGTGTVTREQVVETYLTGSDRSPLGLVVAAAIWGTGTRARMWPGYVQAALDQPDRTRALIADLEGAVARGPAAAFEALWEAPKFSRARLRGFGTAFGTKLLNFIGVALDAPTPRPLIFDLMVSRGLAAVEARWPADLDPDERCRTFDPSTGCVRFKSYEAWCQLAEGIAANASYSVYDVEYSFFQLGRQVGTEVALPMSGCSARVRSPSDADHEFEPVAASSVSSELFDELRAHAAAQARDNSAQ